MELHPIDTFLEVTDEPVAGGDDSVYLRRGHMAHWLQSYSQVKADILCSIWYWSDGMLDPQSGADDSCAPLCRANNSSDIQHVAVSNDAENISSNSALICVYVEL